MEPPLTAMELTKEWYAQLLREFSQAEHLAFVETEEQAKRLSLSLSLPQAHAQEELRAFLFRQSQLHRSNFQTLLSAIDAHAESLSRDAHDDADDSIRSALSMLEQEVDVLDKLKSTWQLAEMALLNPQRFVVKECVEWLQSLAAPVELPYSLSRTSSHIHTHPESDDKFWPAVYALAMRGQLTTLAQTLSTHSEIALALSYTSTHTHGTHAHAQALLTTRERERESARQKTRSECEALLDLFLTHPFTTHTLAPADSHALSLWREKVDIVRNSALAMRIPELDTLFRIFLGEGECLRVMCGGDWAVLALSECVYVYAGALSRANLSRIVSESMGALGVDNRIDDRLHEDFLTFFGGAAGAVLKSMCSFFENNLSPEKSPTDSNIVCLWATAHLTHLLTRSGQCAELSARLCEGLTLLEYVVLRVCEAANERNFPVQMISEALSVCPTHGTETVARLLTQRVLTSDEEAVEVSLCLRAAQCHAQAREVLVKRAMQWLDSSTLRALRRSIAENVILFGSIPSIDDPESPCFALARAAPLFVHASHYDALLSLCDLSLSRCAQAVRMCDNIDGFLGLEMFPAQPVDSWNRRMRVGTERCPREEIIVSADKLAESKEFYDDNRDLERCVISPTLSLPISLSVEDYNGLAKSVYLLPSPTQTAMKNNWTPEDKKIMLFYALSEACALTDALSVYDKHIWDKYPAVLQGIEALSLYCEAVRSVLNAMQLTVIVEGSLVVRIEDESDVKREIQRIKELRNAARCVSLLLRAHNDRQPAVNVRYWLHFLDLAIWLHTRTNHAELALSLSPLYLAALDGADEEVRTETEGWFRGVYSLPETTRFLDIFEFLQQTQEDLAKSEEHKHVSEFLYSLCGATTVRRSQLRAALVSLVTTTEVVHKQEVAQSGKTRFSSGRALTWKHKLPVQQQIRYANGSFFPRSAVKEERTPGGTSVFSPTNAKRL